MLTADRKSNHAEKRARQRCVPEIALILLDQFGAREPAGSGAERVYFDKKAWKKVERAFGSWPLKKMEQLRRVYTIVADGTIVTIAYQQ
jgi:hypothetical protein